MTLGTKVGWGLEADLLCLKQAVFLGWWWGASVSRAKAQATVFVLGVLKRRFPVAAGNARSTRIRAPEVVPEFTAKAFADHHRRIRLASRCEPKTMDTLGCSGGKPWQTPHFVGNGKAAVRAGPVPLGTSPTRPQPSFHRCDRALNGRLQTACIAKVEGTAWC